MDSGEPQDAKSVILPQDVMVSSKVNPNSPNGVNSGFFDGATYIYTNRLPVTDENKDKIKYLYFDGCYMNTFVYVNGMLAGSCHYGYSGFVIRIDPLLSGAENEIRVVAKNGAMPNCRWYSGGGLYRDVYLLEGESTHIPFGGLKISTVSVQEDYAVIRISCEIENLSAYARKLEIALHVSGPDGEAAAEDAGVYTAFPGQSGKYVQNLVVPKALLWSESTPALYRCEAVLKDADGIVDTAEETFGIRIMELDSVRGLRINGKPTELRGAAIHPDNGLLGAVSAYEVEKRRLEKLKEAGFNAVVMAHNPSSMAFFQAADAVGIYVYEELFDMWTKSKTHYDYSQYFMDDWRKDMASMVTRAYNHPSVIGYVIGNEIPETGNPLGAKLCREMMAYLKELDSHRYTVNAINAVFGCGDALGIIMGELAAEAQTVDDQGHVEGSINDFMSALDAQWDRIVSHPLIAERTQEAYQAADLAGYQYMTARYEVDRELYPNRIIVGTEAYPPKAEENWYQIRRNPNVIGDFTWTGWDYIGEAGVGVPGYDGAGGFNKPYPCFLAGVGDLDITGFRKPVSYYREIVFGLREDPYICVQDPAKYECTVEKTPWILTDAVSCWNWPGYEGKPVHIEVYYPGDRVELYVNGMLAGSCEKTGRCSIAYFSTYYAPGTLKAVAYENGVQIGSYELKGASENTHIALYPEKKTLKPGYDDYLYLDVRIEDENGIVDASQDIAYELDVTGAAFLAGVGNANVYHEAECFCNHPKTYMGRGQIILRSTDETGEIRVTVKAEGYGTAACRCESK